ncbi:MAG: acylneuraminate cytidylyltransferase family protein [Candidatus Rokubacteria bacterium]|nr:acylneuraminate cytidylyltransferase family protein [Candidatus Rokubacteria bacterium]
MARAIGVIPARGGSERLPGKNTRVIAGKPLLAYTIAAAKRASSLSEVIVSTEDDGIARLAREHGSRVVMRPAELARSDSPIDDAMRHACDEAQRHDETPIDIVVCMQANVPVRKDGEIDEVVSRLRAAPWATAVATGYCVQQRPEWMKRIKDRVTMEIEPFMDAGTAYRTQDLPDLYLLDGAVVAVRAEVLRRAAGDRRVHAYMGERILVVTHDPRYAVEVDEEPDVDLAEFFLARAPRS